VEFEHFRDKSNRSYFDLLNDTSELWKDEIIYIIQGKIKLKELQKGNVDDRAISKGNE